MMTTEPTETDHLTVTGRFLAKPVPLTITTLPGEPTTGTSFSVGTPGLPCLGTVVVVEWPGLVVGVVEGGGVVGEFGTVVVVVGTGGGGVPGGEIATDAAAEAAGLDLRNGVWPGPFTLKIPDVPGAGGTLPPAESVSVTWAV